MSLITVQLHGFMGKKYGKTAILAGENMYQIMSGLVSRFGAEFKEDIRTHDWHVCENKVKAGNDLDELDIQNKKIKAKILHLLPAVEGASGALRVILGAVLIVVGMVFAQPWLVKFGISMVLGGIAEMLTKPNNSSPSQPQDQRGSSIYNGAVNVITQGGPIPLIYGRVSRASGVVISTDFSNDEA
jgi:predicted phage tail protein